jgi:agmatine/peptidylarginine deiminase
MLSKEAFTRSATDTTTDGNIEKSLIVLSAPSVKDTYYSSKLIEIIDYMVNFANLIIGKDEVVILADADTLPQFKEKVSSNILIEAAIDDIWIRDFSPVISTKQVKFKFFPSYISKSESKQIDNNFEKWFAQNGLEYHAKSDIILDGGNVVDNVSGTRVIITDHILRDNPSLTKSSAKDKLKQLLGANEIAIIREIPDDTTGHADGLAMWPMDDKIFLIKTDEPIHTQIVNELESSFPGVQIIEVPNYIPTTTWKNFTTAHNCFVNSIVTDGYIYMPTFNNTHDIEMLELLKLHTNKTVVPVSAEKIAMMGGSVRCLSWQIKNINKTKILQLVKQ